MEWLATIFTGGAAGVAGGVVGAIGSIASKWMALKQAKLEGEQKLAELRLEAELIDKEAQRDIAVARIQQETQQAIADAASLSASLQADRAAYSTRVDVSGEGWGNWTLRCLLVLVDVVRGIMRPYITAASQLVLVWVAYEAFVRLGEAGVSAELLREVLREVVLASIFIATTATTWWFGARPSSIRKVER